MWLVIHALTDSKVLGANMGTIRGRQGPGGPHVGPMDFVIWANFNCGLAKPFSPLLKSWHGWIIASHSKLWMRLLIHVLISSNKRGPLWINKKKMLWQLVNVYILNCTEGAKYVFVIDQYHNAPVPYPTIHHVVTEMCTCVHISATKCCIVGYTSNAIASMFK